MATHALTTPACPRLSSGEPRITSAELLALINEPSPKRKGTIRALIVRHIPRRPDGADLGLSAVIA